MGLHTADAIVLRRYPFRETSVTLSCLTDRFGKLKGLVKGLRAQPNRYRSAMEPLTINRIVFYDTLSSQLHLISQCELLSPLTELQRNVETMRAASCCIELVENLVPLEEPQPATYRLLKQTLEHLTVAGEDHLGVRLHFIVRLLRLVGFQPRLDVCTGCGTTAQPPGYWSARQGGLLCPRCLHMDPRAEASVPGMLEALEELSTGDAPVQLAQPVASALDQRLTEFLRWRLDRPLKTLTT